MPLPAFLCGKSRRRRLVALTLAFFGWVAPGFSADSLKSGDSPPTGFDWMGVPFAKYRTDFGLGAGVKVAFFDYGIREHFPYRYTLEVQTFATLLGMQDHVLYFFAPRWGGMMDVDAEVRLEVVDNSRYFGIGNDAAYQSAYSEKGRPEFLSQRYYEYRRTRPRFVANLQTRLPWHFKGLAGLGVQYTDVKFHGNSSADNLLRAQSPFGVGGGYTNFLKAGLVYDTRDNVAATERGTWSEMTMEWAHAGLGSTYAYRRYTVADRRYFKMRENWVIAHRTLFEWMGGDPPFYEYSFVGGSGTMMEAAGGDKSLRGYNQNRFIDKSKFLTNTEVRLRFAGARYKREHFDFFAVGFVDLGRVYPAPRDFTLRGLHRTQGGGLRLAWNRYFIGRIDLGFSPDGMGLNIGFANIF